MTTNDVFLDACKGLVMHCNCNILILNVLGNFRAYIAPEVRLKTRECRYNEVFHNLLVLFQYLFNSADTN